VGHAELAALQRRFASRYGRLLVVCPVEGQVDVDARHAGLGARVLAEDANVGRLYRLEPAGLRPLD
jgi:hypothetical protein